ncbi:MAG: hypothetical protein CFH01_01167 [Alphaproteobacteria bacterium MarineAlpha2_Bin1]|nr:MAG: hypothetical protein CFH01_01167 [Alphaproteobacteria bacterium MarineAlpha2_Bin1]
MRIPRPEAVFYPSDYLINARLKKSILSCFELVCPDAPDEAFDTSFKVLDIALSVLEKSSAAYHNVEHTSLVTQCGLDIIEAISLQIGKLNSEDLTSYIVALLCHDIGYVRGICKQDEKNRQIISLDGKFVEIEDYKTDASLTPYHVERGKIFVEERISEFPLVNVEKVKEFISETTFPVPNKERTNETGSFYDYAACVQAADLIGQMGDPKYISKLSKLFLEFKETGAAKMMKITSPVDLKDTYPQFFWSSVYEHIKDHINILEQSPRGKKWITSLYKNVFTRQKSETFSLSAQILFDRMLKLISKAETNFEIFQGLAKGLLEFYDGLIAHVYELDNDGEVLRSKKIWSVKEGNHKIKEFIKESERITFESGHGMPGRCLEFKEPQWHEDFSALDIKTFPRAKLALSVGVKAGIAIPIFTGSEVTAVIEIFSEEKRLPSNEDLSFIRLVTDYVATQFEL